MLKSARQESTYDSFGTLQRKKPLCKRITEQFKSTAIVLLLALGLVGYFVSSNIKSSIFVTSLDISPTIDFDFENNTNGTENNVGSAAANRNLLSYDGPLVLFKYKDILHGGSIYIGTNEHGNFDPLSADGKFECERVIECERKICLVDLKDKNHFSNSKHSPQIKWRTLDNFETQSYVSHRCYERALILA